MRLPAGLDLEALLFLERHETRVHALPGREIRELGDALVLFDPLDRDPFWNRAAAIRWPDDPAAFDRRLAETIGLFAILDRTPHIWPRPALNQPDDLVDRLLAKGWRDAGGGLVMVLTDPDPVREAAAAASALPGGTTIVSLGELASEELAAAADEVAAVLAESFDVEPGRRAAIALETRGLPAHPGVEVWLIRVDGEPAAVAKCTTFDGASYLSSIGTRVPFRGRGLGRLATATASAAGLRAGSRWIYLGVFAENVRAQRVYASLGFEQVGGEAPDLFLR
jgi:ribosomal protein S18 acetylase RimI-like enzyme